MPSLQMNIVIMWERLGEPIRLLEEMPRLGSNAFPLFRTLMTGGGARTSILKMHCASIAHDTLPQPMQNAFLWSSLRRSVHITALDLTKYHMM